MIFSIQSVHSVSIVVTTWLDQIALERRNVQEAFKRLQFFAQNVKARDQLDVVQVERIEHFVQVALACHLQLRQENNVGNQMPRKEWIYSIMMSFLATTCRK